MRHIIILLVLIFGISSFSMAQSGLDCYCTQVNDDGSTTITYQTLTGTGFVEYIIAAYDNASASYLRVGGVSDINTNSYTDNTHNANNEQIKYLVTADFGEEQRPFGYIKTIFLTAIQQTSNTISLSWTIPGTSVVGLSNAQYKIYRKQHTTGDIWQQVANVTQAHNTYVDTIPPVCSDSLAYKIEIDNTNGCTLRSNTSKLVVGDTEQPDMPTLNTCSVNVDSQQIELSWTPSTANDVYGYVVCSGNPCVTLDTIWGKNSSTYTCNSCVVTDINSLAIMSFDSCFNTSLRTEAHNNMVLHVTQTPCSNKFSFSWNNYVNIPSGVERYDIYRKMNSETNYTLVGSSTTNNAEINLQNENGQCKFYVEAVSNSGLKAKSNVFTITQNPADTLLYLYLRSASVESDNNKVTIRAYVDNSKTVSGYKLFRSIDGESFEEINNIAFTGEDHYTIEDNLPKSANEHIFSYYLQAPDACNLIYTSSNKVSTMKLAIEEVTLTENKLTWTPFIGWSPSSYEIYRFSQGSTTPIFIGSTAQTTYNDDVGSLLSASDKTFYYVKAIEGSTPPDNHQENAISSYNFIKRATLFFIPNAFAPKDGTNPEVQTFKPICHFIRNGSYQMKIYNRWGNLLFSTNNTEEGWDGKYKGEFCPVGTYIYWIQYINSDGKKETKGGAFTLYD
jgi:gliding motility-associated-like protein